MTEAIIAIVVLLGGIFTAWRTAYKKGRADVASEIQIDQHNEFIATRKRIQDAIDASRSSGARAGDWHDRLRQDAAANKRDL